MRGFHTKSPNFIKFSEATSSHLWSSFLRSRPGKHNDSVVLSTPLPFYLFSLPLLQFLPLLFFPPLKPCSFILMYKTFQIPLLPMSCPLLKEMSLSCIQNSNLSPSLRLFLKPFQNPFFHSGNLHLRYFQDFRDFRLCHILKIAHVYKLSLSGVQIF